MELPNAPIPSPEETDLSSSGMGARPQQTVRPMNNNQKMLLAFLLIAAFVGAVLAVVLTASQKKAGLEKINGDNPVKKTETVKNDSMSLARMNANDAKRQSDMRQMLSAQELRFGDIKRYYTCNEFGGDCGGEPNNYPAGIGDILNPAPRDPLDTGTVCGQDYIYCGLDNMNQSQNFCYFAKLETGGFYVVSPLVNFKKDRAPVNFSDCEDPQVIKKTSPSANVNINTEINMNTAPVLAGAMVQIYPVDAEKSSCTNNSGKKYPGTGQGAARWFQWGNCSNWKIFAVDAGKPIKLKMNGDNDVCGTADFSVNEIGDDGRWQDIATYNYHLGSSEKSIDYTPKTSRIRIMAYSCFYLDVFKK